MACAGTPASRPRLLLAATILASSLDYVDSSVVNVGLPALSRSLGGDAAELQWVVNAYALPLAALILLGGDLGDRFGRRRLLIIGIVLFALGSAACAAAPSLVWLIAARAFQGLAAAMMLPNSLAVLGEAFEGGVRGRAVGIWAASTAIATAIGPVLGGWLIDTVGWRAIFLVNLPLAVVAVGAGLYAIPRRREAGARAPLDVTGAALVTAAVACLTWGLTEAARPGGLAPAPLAAIAAGAALAGAFVALEARRGATAMTPLALFASRPLVALNLLTLLLYGALSAFMLLTPYVLISALGYSATAAGAALLPFPLVMGLASPFLGDLAGRLGARGPLIAGASLVAAGLALALLDGHAGPYWLRVLPSVLLVAFGMSAAAAPLTAAVLAAVDPAHTGVASGLNSALAQLGGVIAIALLGAVLGRHGAALVGAFDVAMVAAAAAALAAAVAIALLYPRPAATAGNAAARPPA
jgi:EmrB/QacA subfamily drug resistance transporter